MKGCRSRKSRDPTAPTHLKQTRRFKSVLSISPRKRAAQHNDGTITSAPNTPASPSHNGNLTQIATFRRQSRPRIVNGLNKSPVKTSQRLFAASALGTTSLPTPHSVEPTATAIRAQLFYNGNPTPHSGIKRGNIPFHFNPPHPDNLLPLTSKPYPRSRTMFKFYPHLSQHAPAPAGPGNTKMTNLSQLVDLDIDNPEEFGSDCKDRSDKDSIEHFEPHQRRNGFYPRTTTKKHNTHTKPFHASKENHPTHSWDNFNSNNTTTNNTPPTTNNNTTNNTTHTNNNTTNDTTINYTDHDTNNDIIASSKNNRHIENNPPKSTITWKKNQSQPHHGQSSQDDNDDGDEDNNHSSILRKYEHCQLNEAEGVILSYLHLDNPLQAYQAFFTNQNYKNIRIFTDTSNRYIPCLIADEQPFQIPSSHITTSSQLSLHPHSSHPDPSTRPTPKTKPGSLKGTWNNTPLSAIQCSTENYLPPFHPITIVYTLMTQLMQQSLVEQAYNVYTTSKQELIRHFQESYSHNRSISSKPVILNPLPFPAALPLIGLVPIMLESFTKLPPSTRNVAKVQQLTNDGQECVLYTQQHSSYMLARSRLYKNDGLGNVTETGKLHPENTQHSTTTSSPHLEYIYRVLPNSKLVTESNYLSTGSDDDPLPASPYPYPFCLPTPTLLSLGKRDLIQFENNIIFAAAQAYLKAADYYAPSRTHAPAAADLASQDAIKPQNGNDNLTHNKNEEDQLILSRNDLNLLREKAPQTKQKPPKKSRIYKELGQRVNSVQDFYARLLTPTNTITRLRPNMIPAVMAKAKERLMATTYYPIRRQGKTPKLNKHLTRFTRFIRPGGLGLYDRKSALPSTIQLASVLTLAQRAALNATLPTAVVLGPHNPLKRTPIISNPNKTKLLPYLLLPQSNTKNNPFATTQMLLEMAATLLTQQIARASAYGDNIDLFSPTPHLLSPPLQPYTVVNFFSIYDGDSNSPPSMTQRDNPNQTNPTQNRKQQQQQQQQQRRKSITIVPDDYYNTLTDYIQPTISPIPRYSVFLTNALLHTYIKLEQHDKITQFMSNLARFANISLLHGDKFMNQTTFDLLFTYITTHTPSTLSSISVVMRLLHHTTTQQRFERALFTETIAQLNQIAPPPTIGNISRQHILNLDLAVDEYGHVTPQYDISKTRNYLQHLESIRHLPQARELIQASHRLISSGVISNPDQFIIHGLPDINAVQRALLGDDSLDEFGQVIKTTNQLSREIGLFGRFGRNLKQTIQRQAPTAEEIYGLDSSTKVKLFDVDSQGTSPLNTQGDDVHPLKVYLRSQLFINSLSNLPLKSRYRGATATDFGRIGDDPFGTPLHKTENDPLSALKLSTSIVPPAQSGTVRITHHAIGSNPDLHHSPDPDPSRFPGMGGDEKTAMASQKHPEVVNDILRHHNNLLNLAYSFQTIHTGSKSVKLLSELATDVNLSLLRPHDSVQPWSLHNHRTVNINSYLNSYVNPYNPLPNFAYDWLGKQGVRPQPISEVADFTSYHSSTGSVLALSTRGIASPHGLHRARQSILSQARDGAPILYLSPYQVNFGIFGGDTSSSGMKDIISRAETVVMNIHYKPSTVDTPPVGADGGNKPDDYPSWASTSPIPSPTQHLVHNAKIKTVSKLVETHPISGLSRELFPHNPERNLIHQDLSHFYYDTQGNLLPPQETSLKPFQQLEPHLWGSIFSPTHSTSLFRLPPPTALSVELINPTLGDQRTARRPHRQSNLRANQYDDEDRVYIDASADDHEYNIDDGGNTVMNNDMSGTNSRYNDPIMTVAEADREETLEWIQLIHQLASLFDQYNGDISAPILALARKFTSRFNYLEGELKLTHQLMAYEMCLRDSENISPTSNSNPISGTFYNHDIQDLLIDGNTIFNLSNTTTSTAAIIRSSGSAPPKVGESKLYFDIASEHIPRTHLNSTTPVGQHPAIVYSDFITQIGDVAHQLSRICQELKNGSDGFATSPIETQFPSTMIPAGTSPSTYYHNNHSIGVKMKKLVQEYAPHLSTAMASLAPLHTPISHPNLPTHPLMVDPGHMLQVILGSHSTIIPQAKVSFLLSQLELVQQSTQTTLNTGHIEKVFGREYPEVVQAFKWMPIAWGLLTNSLPKIKRTPSMTTNHQDIHLSNPTDRTPDATSPITTPSAEKSPLNSLWFTEDHLFPISRSNPRQGTSSLLLQQQHQQNQQQQQQQQQALPKHFSHDNDTALPTKTSLIPNFVASPSSTHAVFTTTLRLLNTHQFSTATSYLLQHMSERRPISRLVRDTFLFHASQNAELYHSNPRAVLSMTPRSGAYQPLHTNSLFWSFYNKKAEMAQKRWFKKHNSLNSSPNSFIESLWDQPDVNDDEFSAVGTSDIDYLQTGPNFDELTTLLSPTSPYPLLRSHIHHQDSQGHKYNPRGYYVARRHRPYRLDTVDDGDEEIWGEKQFNTHLLDEASAFTVPLYSPEYNDNGHQNRLGNSNNKNNQNDGLTKPKFRTPYERERYLQRAGLSKPSYIYNPDGSKALRWSDINLLQTHDKWVGFLRSAEYADFHKVLMLYDFVLSNHAQLGPQFQSQRRGSGVATQFPVQHIVTTGGAQRDQSVKVQQTGGIDVGIASTDRMVPNVSGGDHSGNTSDNGDDERTGRNRSTPAPLPLSIADGVPGVSVASITATKYDIHPANFYHTSTPNSFALALSGLESSASNIQTNLPRTINFLDRAPMVPLSYALRIIEYKPLNEILPYLTSQRAFAAHSKIYSTMTPRDAKWRTDRTSFEPHSTMLWRNAGDTYSSEYWDSYGPSSFLHDRFDGFLQSLAKNPSRNPEYYKSGMYSPYHSAISAILLDAAAMEPRYTTEMSRGVQDGVVQNNSSYPLRLRQLIQNFRTSQDPKERHRLIQEHEELIRFEAKVRHQQYLDRQQQDFPLHGSRGKGGSPQKPSSSPPSIPSPHITPDTDPITLSPYHHSHYYHPNPNGARQGVRSSGSQNALAISSAEYDPIKYHKSAYDDSKQRSYVLSPTGRRLPNLTYHIPMATLYSNLNLSSLPWAKQADQTSKLISVDGNYWLQRAHSLELQRSTQYSTTEFNLGELGSLFRLTNHRKSEHHRNGKRYSRARTRRRLRPSQPLPIDLPSSVLSMANYNRLVRFLYANRPQHLPIVANAPSLNDNNDENKNKDDFIDITLASQGTPPMAQAARQVTAPITSFSIETGFQFYKSTTQQIKHQLYDLLQAVHDETFENKLQSPQSSSTAAQDALNVLEERISRPLLGPVNKLIGLGQRHTQIFINNAIFNTNPALLNPQTLLTTPTKDLSPEQLHALATLRLSQPLSFVTTTYLPPGQVAKLRIVRSQAKKSRGANSDLPIHKHYRSNSMHFLSSSADIKGHGLADYIPYQDAVYNGFSALSINSNAPPAPRPYKNDRIFSHNFSASGTSGHNHRILFLNVKEFERRGSPQSHDHDITTQNSSQQLSARHNPQSASYQYHDENTNLSYHQQTRFARLPMTFGVSNRHRIVTLSYVPNHLHTSGFSHSDPSGRAHSMRDNIVLSRGMEPAPMIIGSPTLHEEERKQPPSHFIDLTFQHFQPASHEPFMQGTTIVPQVQHGQTYQFQIDTPFSTQYIRVPRSLQQFYDDFDDNMAGEIFDEVLSKLERDQAPGLQTGGDSIIRNLFFATSIQSGYHDRIRKTFSVPSYPASTPFGFENWDQNGDNIYQLYNSGGFSTPKLTKCPRSDVSNEHQQMITEKNQAINRESTLQTSIKNIKQQMQQSQFGHHDSIDFPNQIFLSLILAILDDNKINSAIEEAGDVPYGVAFRPVEQAKKGSTTNTPSKQASPWSTIHSHYHHSNATDVSTSSATPTAITFEPIAKQWCDNIINSPHIISPIHAVDSFHQSTDVYSPWQKMTKYNTVPLLNLTPLPLSQQLQHTFPVDNLSPDLSFRGENGTYQRANPETNPPTNTNSPHHPLTTTSNPNHFSQFESFNDAQATRLNALLSYSLFDDDLTPPITNPDYITMLINQSQTESPTSMVGRTPPNLTPPHNSPHLPLWLQWSALSTDTPHDESRVMKFSNSFTNQFSPIAYDLFLSSIGDSRHNPHGRLMREQLLNRHDKTVVNGIDMVLNGTNCDDNLSTKINPKPKTSLLEQFHANMVPAAIPARDILIDMSRDKSIMSYKNSTHRAKKIWRTEYELENFPSPTQEQDLGF